MTLGEKIRYFRTQIGITQGRLAELAELHPVSVRKYETNKMVPQQAQIDRIAQALGISSFALTGTDSNIQLNTQGDFMGLFFLLYKAQVISLEGIRGDDGMLQPETVQCKISPFLSQHFSAVTSTANCEASSISYLFSSPELLNDILQWEKFAHGYPLKMEKYQDSKEPAVQAALEDMAQTLEKIEMEYQRSSLVIKNENLSVSLPPDLSEMD